MTTTITKTIGNGGSANGYDYGDFNAFAASIPTDLVTADEQWIAEVYATHGELSFTTVQSITGKTVDATRNIIVRAAAGQGFADHASKLTNALRYNASNGAAMTNSAGAWGTAFDFSSVSRVEGLQIKTTASLTCSLLLTGEMIACIVDAASNAYQNSVVRANLMTNSLVVCRAFNSYETALLRFNWNGTASHCSGVTVICLASGMYAMQQEGGGMTLADSAFFGCTAGAFQNGGGWSVTFNNCATDLSSLTGSNNLTSLTATDQFESMTAGSLDLRVKAGSSLIGAGAADSSYTNDLDIIEQTRSTTAPTIGAWEVASASSPTATFTITTADATFSGSGQVSPIASFALTASDATFSGSASSGSSDATFSVTTEDGTFAGTATGDTSNGTLTTPALKNNTGTVLANETGATAYVYNPTTGALVVAKTGQTTNASGVMTITDALIVPATQYRVVIVLGSGAEGMDKLTAA